MLSSNTWIDKQTEWLLDNERSAFKLCMVRIKHKSNMSYDRMTKIQPCAVIFRFFQSCEERLGKSKGKNCNMC